ncbi:MAG: hypothetical protein IKU26_03820 [Clostridia bacterium]|nr:hypothetical protein [Clostridia bacterium]
MKKILAIAAFVLTMALVLSSFMMPAATTATGSASNWYVSAGGELSNEKSEIWVIDTATVHLTKKDGFVQNTQKLTELIGTDGKDGKGYINVIIEDGTAAKFNSLGFCVVQLVGSADTSSAVDHTKTTSKGMNWYIRSEETDENGSALVYNKTVSGSDVYYGKYKDIAKAGVRFLFTSKDDGLVYIRSNGVGAGDTFHNYEVTAAEGVKSEAQLSTIEGDNGETGEDGVYARFHTKTSSVDLNVTVSVAYPMPADYNPNVSHWAVGGGSTIVSQSTEYLAVDTVTVKLPAQGYLQHKEKLTDLIGADGQDGKGFINVIVEDGSVAKAKECYVQMMLVGKADPTVAVPNNAVTNQGFSWYLRPDGNASQSNGYLQTQGRICNANASGANEYGLWENFGAEGFRFAFSADSEDRVLARGIGNGIIGNAYKSSTNDYTGNPFYNVTKYSQSVKMATKLSDVQGDNGETAEDGVYYRLHSRRDSATMSFTTTVAYPCEAPAVSTPTETPVATATPTPTEAPTGPVNLVPEDLFASKEKAQQWFGGTLPGTFSEENGEYVYSATTALNGIYTTQALPDGSFTVKMNIKPSEFVNSKNAQAYSGMGILLGRSAGGNNVPWTNIRFDADYATKTMKFYVWEKTSNNRDIVAKEYGTAWYEGEFPEDMWFEVIMEFTSTGTKIYLDGYEVPQMTDGYTPPADSLGHFPTADELKFIGFFPSGANYSIKNFEVYEGVGLQLGALAPEATTPPAAPSATPGAQNKPTGDSSVMMIALTVALCAGGIIVFSKKRSHAA